METIKINDIQLKGPAKTICVVKYQQPDAILGSEGSFAEATLNTKWQSQEIDYLQKDVGIGGQVKVEIEVKGQYTNITKVDFESALMSDSKFVAEQKVINDPYNVNRGKDVEVTRVGTPLGYENDRSKSIIAQCLTKISHRNVPPEGSSPEGVLATYNYFLKEL